MKYLIASDIHGSSYYCEKLLEAFEREQADRLLLLGDLLYHGARNDLPAEYSTKKVFALLNGIKDRILAVRGNCDSEVDQMVLECPIMADYLLLQEEGLTIFATHGHLYGPENLPPVSGLDVILTGHTHISKCRKITDSLWYMNPGSVSIPLDHRKIHGYMTLEKGLFSWKNVEDGREYRSLQL